MANRRGPDDQSTWTTVAASSCTPHFRAYWLPPLVRCDRRCASAPPPATRCVKVGVHHLARDRRRCLNAKAAVFSESHQGDCRLFERLPARYTRRDRAVISTNLGGFCIRRRADQTPELCQSNRRWCIWHSETRCDQYPLSPHRRGAQNGVDMGLPWWNAYSRGPAASVVIRRYVRPAPASPDAARTPPAIGKDCGGVGHLQRREDIETPARCPSET